MRTAHSHPSFSDSHLASFPPSGWPHRAFGKDMPVRQIPAHDRAKKCETCGKLGHARPIANPPLRPAGIQVSARVVRDQGLAKPAAFCGMLVRPLPSRPPPLSNTPLLVREGLGVRSVSVSSPLRLPPARNPNSRFPAAEGLGLKSPIGYRGEVHAKICCILRYAWTVGPPQTHNLRQIGACPGASFARVQSPPPFAPRQRSHGRGPASRSVFVRGVVGRFGLSGGRTQASWPITKRGAVPARIIAWHIPCSCDNRGDRATE